MAAVDSDADVMPDLHGMSAREALPRKRNGVERDWLDRHPLQWNYRFR